MAPSRRRRHRCRRSRRRQPIAARGAIAIEEGAGPGVLLIHGQPGSGSDWDVLASLLKDSHRVVALDRPGWGDNPSPATGMGANASQLLAILEGLEAGGGWTAVGHSLGGGVAIEMALARPDVVGALVLLASVGVDVALSAADRVLAVPRVSDPVLRAGIGAVHFTRSAAKRFSDRPAVNWVSERLSASPTVRALAWIDERPISERSRQSFIVEQKALIEETPSLQRRLALLRVPAVVVHGTADRIVPSAAARLLAERIPGAEYVSVAGEGHLLPLERPERVAPIISRYSALAALGAEPGGAAGRGGAAGAG